MSKRLALILLVFLIAFSGCSAAAPKQTASYAPAVPQSAPAERGAAPAPNFDAAGKAANNNVPALDTSATSSNSAADNRLVIRNANLTIIVDDPGSALAAVTQMAGKMGGFVVTSNLFKTSNGQGREFPEANITVRVPAEKLNDALDQIKGLVKDKANDVQAETVSGQDVTKEYTDLQSRLNNLTAAEAQLREIMASATKTEDVLAVYNQLIQIREQIEVIKGQIQYYQESAAMSSIAVQIKAQASVQPLEIGGWKPIGVARDAVQALIDALQFLGSAAIWLILFALPVGLLIFLPLRLLWWLIRRGRKPKLPAVPPPAAPQTPAA